jgi:hypothetical protein
MKLLTKKILAAFQKQGDTTAKSCKNTRIIAKYFSPCSSYTWYAAEYDSSTRMFYGFISVGDLRCDGLGSFSLLEFKNITLPGRLKIERDKFFEPGKYSLKDILDGKRP